MRAGKPWCAAALVVSLASGMGCSFADDSGDEDPQRNDARQAALSTELGLRTIHGLRTASGLMATTGLSHGNGLCTTDGVRTINGLGTVRGLSVSNGLGVDCTGKTVGVDCGGAPDGLMSATTGLMSNDASEQLAKYVVRCALPAGDSLRIKDYTGGVVSLLGELGLAPGWKDGPCAAACQEKVSACLMAFTNGDGAHVDVELAAPFTLGTQHTYPYAEASFYGNLFESPVQAFYCIAKDYAPTWTGHKALENRSCVGYHKRGGECPYTLTGYCAAKPAWDTWVASQQLPQKACSYASAGAPALDTANTCQSGAGRTARTWAHPISTYRQTKL